MNNLVFALFVGTAIAHPTTAFACDDPFVGVWQLDLQKSGFSTGVGVRSKTLMFSEIEAGMRINETVVTEKGETVVYRIPVTYDGGFVAQNANANYDSVAVKRADPRTLLSTLKLQGKLVGKAKQRMEFTSELTVPSGEVARQASVFRPIG